MFQIVKYLLDIFVLGTCFISSITDFRYGKIYNRILKIGFLAGGMVEIVYLSGNPRFIPVYILNLLAAFFLGFGFFKFKFWGAGDAKLWLLVAFLFPYEQYFRTEYMIVPVMNIFMIIFAIAYFYVLFESLVLFLKKKKIIQGVYQKTNYKDFLLQFFWGFSLISLLSWVLQITLKQYFFQNQLFFSMTFLLLLQWLSGKNIKRKGFCTAVMAAVYIGVELLGHQVHFRQYLVNLIIILIVLFMQKAGAKYNYQEIAAEEVKEGMILSQMTVAGFQISRVKNLPQFTDETTKSRISKEEADAVRRWKTSKYGKASVVIVSILPFAVFEFLGVLIYLTACYFM